MELGRTIHKPEPRKRVKGRKQRLESRVIKAVRALCVTRDGDCRIANWEDNPDDWHEDDLDQWCEGASEWAHLGDKKRFKTRGQAPEIRHTTAGSLMLCTKHHQDYDQGRMTIDGNDANLPLKFERV
jgi:hypothetical protein